MKDKRFEIIGEIDNIEIPDEVEQDEPNKSSNSGFRLRVNKDNISEFIKNARGNGDKPPMPSQKEIDALMKSSGMSKEQMDEMIKDIQLFINSTVNEDFLSSLEEIISDKGSALSQKDIDKEFDKLFASLSELEDIEDDEIEVEFEEELSTLNYESLIEGESFGAVLCDRNPDMLSDFKAIYGDKKTYDVGIFTPEIKVSNAILGLSYIKNIELVDSTSDMYLIFKGIPLEENLEPLYIALVQLNENFEIVIPEYGNSFNPETGDLFDFNKDPEKFITTPKGRFLMRPADMKKIKAGLDLVLFSQKRTVFSISDFGRVIVNPKKPEIASSFIHIGTIVSNESREAKLFKVDFDLDKEQTSFNFYIKLKKEYSELTAEKIVDYIESVDFNENPKVLGCELKCSQSGKLIYIELDLGDLPDNIDRWSEE
jgi:hypothetical protein